jgi:small subunit ribosomal protein S6
VRERRRDYELMVIVNPLHANEEGITAVVDRLTQTIESNGGAVTGVNQSPPWGRRKLAYPIRDYVSGEASRRSFSEGYYLLLHFSLSAAKVIDLERTIKLTDAILRHLVTLVEHKAVVVDSPEAEEVAEESEA